MRYLLILIGFFLIYILGCCKDDVISTPPILDETCEAEWAPIFHPGKMENGRVVGFKNCRPFMASAGCRISSSEEELFSIGVNTYEDWNGFYANKEFLVLGARASGVGFWPLLLDTLIMLPDTVFHSSIANYWTLQDHDVFEYVFYIDTSYSRNGIYISKIDSLTQYAEGWFEARFIIRSHLNTGPNPDTVTFTQCYFEAYEP